MRDSPGDESALDFDNSRPQTPRYRERSASKESMRSDRRSLSQTSGRSEAPLNRRERSRSRSPRESAVVQAPKQENQVLKQELAQIAAVISRLQAQNQELQEQPRVQDALTMARHGESIKQLSMIQTLLQVQQPKERKGSSRRDTDDERMETNQPSPSRPTRPAQEHPAPA